MISGSKVRSYSLLAVLAGVGCFPLVTNCSNTEDPTTGDEASDDITGVNNALGLGLRYDQTEGRVYASLKQNLKAGEKLFIRVRQGKLTHVSQKNLRCSDLTEVSPIVQSGVAKTGPKGNTLYKGPVVGKNVIDLLTVYEDERWQSNNIPAELTNAVKAGSDPIVEACILSESGKVQAKLQTNLARSGLGRVLGTPVLGATVAPLRMLATVATVAMARHPHASRKVPGAVATLSMLNCASKILAKFRSSRR
jgi:hypothetical protein